MFLIFITLIIATVVLYHYIEFKKSKYQKISGTSFLKVYNNKGILGEFLIFKELKKLDDKLRVLTNLYIPIDDEKYSEIDLLILHETGIYIIESKNYTGWIYGSEYDKTWTQVYSKYKKYKFNNPVTQNQNHVKYLSEYLNIDKSIFKNYIVFGENCKLKKSYIDYEEIRLLKRHSLNKIIKTEFNVSNIIFSQSHLDIMYQELLKLGKQSNEIKRKHIENINSIKAKQESRGEVH